MRTCCFQSRSTQQGSARPGASTAAQLQAVIFGLRHGIVILR
jgi:hypothetical protein